MTETQAREQQRLTLELASARRLAAASRLVGQIDALASIWRFWPEFAQGPLAAAGVVTEAGLLGYKADLAELLALGPMPNPSRPKRGLRLAVGVSLAQEKLKALPVENPLTPGLVTEIFQNIDAPHLARGGDAAGDREIFAPVSGAAVWTLAPRWVTGGLPPLWAAGVALASWEREGPGHRLRSLAGRTLLAGLAPRLGLPAQAFAFLGPALVRVAQEQYKSWPALIKNVRTQGTWRSFVGVFLEAVEISAQRVVETIVQAQDLYESHLDLVENWVRAPRHPIRLLRLFLVRPVMDLPLISAELDVTQRTAGLLVDKLMEHELIHETTGQRRGRRFAYVPLLDVLTSGFYEPQKEKSN